MLGQGLLQTWLVLWLAQYSLQAAVGTGLGMGRAKATGLGLPLGALGARGIGKTAGRYPGAMLGMGAYRGALGRLRPGYGGMGGYGGYGYGINGYGYRGQALGGYGGLGPYPGAGLGLGGPYPGAGLGLGGVGGFGAGAAGYPLAGLADGYGAGYGDGYNLGVNGYGAGLGLPAVLAEGAGLAGKVGKGAGVGARSYGNPALSPAALGPVGPNGDAGVGPAVGRSQLPYGAQPMVPARLGPEVKPELLGEGRVTYVGRPFQPTGLGNDGIPGGLPVGLGLDTVANKYEGAYLGVGVPPAGYSGQPANGQGLYGGKSGKFEVNELMDNGLSG